MANTGQPSVSRNSTQTFNSSASYILTGNLNSYYDRSYQFIHFVVVTQRSNSDAAPPGSPGLAHSTGAMSFLVQAISVPTNNRFKIDIYAFAYYGSSGDVLYGDFTIYPSVNSVAGAAALLNSTYMRTSNPIRTWSTANTVPSIGTNGGGYGSTLTKVPTQGVQGIALTPSPTNQNLVVAVNDGTYAFTVGTGLTSLFAQGSSALGARTLYESTVTAGDPYVGSVTTSGTSFNQLVSFELASVDSADNLYYAPVSTTPTLSNQAVSATDSSLAVGQVTPLTGDSFSLADTTPSVASIEPTYNVYRDGVLVGTVPHYETSFVDTAPEGIHTYTVTAVDAFTNESPASSPGSLIEVDTTPPPVPTNVASSLEEDTVVLTWTG